MALNAIQTELAAGLDEIFSEVGLPVTIAGREYTAVIADPHVEVDLESGGLLAHGDFVVKLRKTDFPDGPPASGSIATVDGVRYSVKASTPKPNAPLYLITLTR